MKHPCMYSCVRPSSWMFGYYEGSVFRGISVPGVPTLSVLKSGQWFLAERRPYVSENEFELTECAIDGYAAMACA